MIWQKLETLDTKYFRIQVEDTEVATLVFRLIG